MKASVSKKLIALSIAGALLTGCSPSTSNKAISKRGTSTSIGAGIGTGIGALLGGGKGAITGAIAGAIIGNFVGKSSSTGLMNQSTNTIGAVRSMNAVKSIGAAAGAGAKISQTARGRLKLDIPNKVTFATAQANITPSFQEALTGIAKTLSANPNINAMIIGHTDCMGTSAKNLTLSEQRAKNVMNFLIQQGVKSNRLSAKGLGKSKPIASNSTEMGRAQNRRVEIILNNTQ